MKKTIWTNTEIIMKSLPDIYILFTAPTFKDIFLKKKNCLVIII